MSKGFAAMTTVLILGAVVLAIAATVTMLSIGEAQSSLALYRGEDNLSFVEGCVEDAMLKARSSPTFGDPTGTPVSIARPEGTCSVTVNSKTGSAPVAWDMSVSTSATDYKRTVKVIFNRATTGITLASWQEVYTPAGPTPAPTSIPTSTPTSTPTATPTPTPAGDTLPPDPVSNLATAAGTDPRTSINLNWSAPADNVGAVSYDIRYSTSAITEANWALAAQASDEPAPAVPGTSQSYTVTGLASNKTYYFAIKSSDAAGNISAISNIPSRKTSR